MGDINGVFLFAVCRVLRGKSVLNRQTRSHESVGWLSSAGVPRASPRLRREVHSGCLMKGLLRLISASRGLLCELACFERYVPHYAGIVGSHFKRSHMIRIGAVRCACQGKLPLFSPWLGVNSAEGRRGHKICLLLHFTGRKIRCL